jgi:ribosomal protein S24E
MEVIHDFRNDLLKRREVKMVVEAESNPGFADAMKIIAEKFKSVEDVIKVNNVKSKFGRNTFLVDSFIYDSLEDRERIEPKPKEKKAKAEGGK